MKISDEEIDRIKQEYSEFKKTPGYEERKNQILFSDFARSIITKLLEKGQIINDNLTALIQIFGNGSSSENVKKYIDSLDLEKPYSEEIFNKFVELGQTGFTGRGKAAVSGLTDQQLNSVREFLVDVAKVDVAKYDSETKIRNLVSEFENKDIPHIKSGIYSPWLYYLYPTVCPILAGPVKDYLRKLGWNSKSYLDAWDIMKQINQAIGETNYGFFDQFVYKMSEDDGKGPRVVVEKRENENQEVEKEKLLKDIEDSWKNNKQSTLMKKLLFNKKQIILYGPPGTGKTFVASNFIRSNIQDQIYSKRTSFDRNFFWFTARSDRRDNEKLWKEPDNGPEVELSYGRIKSAYQKINVGDILFVYVTHSIKQIIATAECIRKEVKNNDIPVVVIKGLRRIEGPKWKDLKSDDILSEAKVVKAGAMGTLFQLNENEASKILDFSNLSLEDLKIEKLVETEIVKNHEFITFHPSFSYEDFIEGLRPLNNDDDGQISYEVDEGLFKKFSRSAFNALMAKAEIEKEWNPMESIPQLTTEEKEKAKKAAEEVPFYLVIDEINRGDMSRIFGELITVLESDKRLTAPNELITTLPYSKTKFAVPPNLYLMGTMNTADKSIALIDVALRRRFGFIEMMPDYSVLEKLLVSDDEGIREIFRLAISAHKTVNENILKTYDRDHQIGHSYLLKLRDSVSRTDAIENFRFIWHYEILPLMQEYFYDAPAKLKQVMGNEFIKVENRSFSFIDKLEGEEFIKAIKRMVNSDKRQNEIGD